MFMLVGLLFLFALPAAIAWGMSAGLRFFAPRSTRRRRVAIAAATSGLLPILLPMASVLAKVGKDPEAIVSIVTLLVGGAIFAIGVGLPVALLHTRGETGRSSASTFD